eukprot:m51a1_g8968 hypothetical protein (222) ;mRNA; r:2871-11219
MKLRVGFVSNSSTSSFIAFSSEHLVDSPAELGRQVADVLEAKFGITSWSESLDTVLVLPVTGPLVDEARSLMPLVARCPRCRAASKSVQKAWTTCLLFCPPVTQKRFRHAVLPSDGGAASGVRTWRELVLAASFDRLVDLSEDDRGSTDEDVEHGMMQLITGDSSDLEWIAWKAGVDNRRKALRRLLRLIVWVNWITIWDVGWAQGSAEQVIQQIQEYEAR